MIRVLLVGLCTLLGVAAQRRTEDIQMLWEFHVVGENTHKTQSMHLDKLKADNNLRAPHAVSHAEPQRAFQPPKRQWAHLPHSPQNCPTPGLPCFCITLAWRKTSLPESKALEVLIYVCGAPFFRILLGQTHISWTRQLPPPNGRLNLFEGGLRVQVSVWLVSTVPLGGG